MNRDRTKARKSCGELIRDVTKPFGNGAADFGGAPWIVVSRRQCDVQEALRSISADTSRMDRDNGMLQIIEVDHRHKRRVLFMGRIRDAELRDRTDKNFKQLCSIETSRDAELLSQPLCGNFQSKVRHAVLLRLL